MKVYFISLGCPKNLTDTEVLMGKFFSSGYTITTNPAHADAIVINTCAFIEPARKEALQVIQEMSRWKKQGKCKKLYVAGCLPKIKDAVLPASVDGIIDSIATFDSHTPRIKATSPWYAYVKIAEGCNNRCSYCRIPQIRGKLKTRSVPDILTEVRQLAKRGVKEIIYIAQDTTAHPQLPSLLKKTAKIKGVQWIRLMYAHPAHVTAPLIAVMSKEPKIVPYLDLPVQHICDKILKNMHRRYSRRQVEDLIARIRRKMPGIALRTSVIVGFPGEGKAEFEELCVFAKKAKFTHLGIFPYWKEAGTVAAKMSGQVTAKTTKARLAKSKRLQTAVLKERNKHLIGQILPVIIEGTNQGGCLGRTCFDAPEVDGVILVHGAKHITPGKIVNVQVTAAQQNNLVGVLI